MAKIQRPFRPGASVFLTICLARRGSDLLVRHIDVLREVAGRTRSDKPFRIEAWVVLPDHMHCVWTLPEGDADYPNRVGMLKARFSRALHEMGVEAEAAVGPHGVIGGRDRSHGTKDRTEAGFWQKRYWDHHIRDDNDLAAHLWYCWQNPVKHGFVESPGEWPYSSWHRDHGQPLAPTRGTPGYTPGYAVDAERQSRQVGATPMSA